MRTQYYDNNLLLHEYGHTFQSRNWGPLYLVVTGLLSLISAGNSENIKDPPFETHNSFWTEKNANRNAKKYFGKHYDVDWNGTSPYYIGRKSINDEEGNFLYYYYFTIEDYFPTK
jgi:hypothetical protein